MAIIISDDRNASYDGNISTVNGFYRAEVGNLACAAAVASLTGTVNYPITFANAGNCMGVVLFLKRTGACNRPLKVELQEFVGGTTWTARTSTTLTAAQIYANSAGIDVSDHTGSIVPFKFATPYAVSTTAGIWRLQFTSTAGTGNWNIRQAVAGTYSLVVWCDNAISFTTNTDQFVAVDDLILDSACILKGSLYTGDTVNAVAGWIGNGTDRTPDLVSRLKWSAVPASSYKVQVSGLIYMGEASGFRAGTSTVPIPISAMGNLEFIPATVGTNVAAISSGFTEPSRGVPGNTAGHIFIYGEIPTYEDTRLTSAAAAGQPVIVTDDVTGWVAGDVLAIGRETNKGTTAQARDGTLYTISSVAGDGKTITLTGNIASARSAGASVIRANGYGFKWNATQTNGGKIQMYQLLNLFISGVQIENINFALPYLSSPVITTFATDLPHTFSHCSSFAKYTYLNVNEGNPYLYAYGNFTPQLKGMTIDHVNLWKMAICGNMYTISTQGPVNITNCITLNNTGLIGAYPTLGGTWNYSYNRHENATTRFVTLTGYNVTHIGNEYWGGNGGGSSAAAPVVVYGLYISTNMGYNKYDNCINAFNLSSIATIFNCKSTGDEFGQISPNTYDLYEHANALVQFEFENFKGNLSIYWWVKSISGTEIRLTKGNQVDGNDRILYEEGDTYKAGTGLSDTTNHNEDYSLKFVPKAPQPAVQPPISYVAPLAWTQRIPTENIQNKDMMVGIWIKIDSASYWAGASADIQMPRITVNYDNGTLAYGEAAQTTDWQFVFTPFTPLTTYGEITVTVDGRTDAVVANAAFYAAEMSVIYPAGHNISMGKMNTWSSALPTMPSISTTISAGDVWAVDPDFFGAGTVGAKLNKIKSIVTGLQ